MGIDLVEQGGDYLVLRSQSTGSLYAVVFETVKGAETPRVAPLAAWLSHGELLGPGDLPAGRTAAKAKPGEVRKLVVATLTEHGEMTVKQIAEASGASPGGVNSALIKLEKEGRATHRVQPRDGAPGLPSHVYRLTAEPRTRAEIRQSKPFTPTPRQQEITAIVREHGPLAAADINERLGIERANTNVFGVLRRLSDEEIVDYREETVDDPANPTGKRKVRLFYAKEPNGPDSSQGRESSESTQPVEGL